MNESLSTTPAAKTRDLANLQDVVQFGKELAHFVETNGMITVIQKSKYVNVDGWKFAGMAFGMTCIPQRPVKREGGKLYVMYFDKWNQWNKAFEPKPALILSDPAEVDRMIAVDAAKPEKERRYKFTREMPEITYECEAKLINFATKEEVNYGYAICSNSEIEKVGFAEYAVASMAQTRAIAKAYRNAIGYLMKAAGFEPTPAEEITEDMVAKPEPKAPEPLSEDVILSIESFDNETEDGWLKFKDYVSQAAELHGNEEFKERCRAKRAQMKFNPDNRKV